VQDKFGLPPDLVSSKVLRRGYFPRGGGEVHVHTNPCRTPMTPIVLMERGDVCEVYIRSHHAGKLPRHVAEEMVKGAVPILNDFLPDIPQKVDIVSETSAVGSGSGILIVAKTSTGCILGGSALGSPKKRARNVGIEAANELTKTLRDGGCVDEWLQDQLILFMAFADGISEVMTGSLTLHTQTAIWVAEQLCGARFTVTKLSSSSQNDRKDSKKCDEGNGTPYGMKGRITGKHLIRCEGMSFINRY